MALDKLAGTAGIDSVTLVGGCLVSMAKASTVDPSDVVWQSRVQSVHQAPSAALDCIASAHAGGRRVVGTDNDSASVPQLLLIHARPRPRMLSQYK